MGDLTDDASLAARRLAVFSVSAYASARLPEAARCAPEPEALMEHDAPASSIAHGRTGPLGPDPGRAALGGLFRRPCDREFTRTAASAGAPSAGITIAPTTWSNS